MGWRTKLYAADQDVEPVIRTARGHQSTRSFPSFAWMVPVASGETKLPRHSSPLGNPGFEDWLGWQPKCLAS